MLHTTKPRISNHINFIECESTKQDKKSMKQIDKITRKSGKWKYVSFLISSTDVCYCCRQKSVIFDSCFSACVFFFHLFVHSLYFGNDSIQVSSFITYASFGCLYLWILCERERLTDWMMSTNRKFGKNKLWKVRDKTAESVSLRI